ncbi:MAG TPA: hypothetical protein VFA86_12980 [Gammaproteobacteria bacterium]|nr:hypothetical protein [Gammaproteobacteria bacterium]
MQLRESWAWSIIVLAIAAAPAHALAGGPPPDSTMTPVTPRDTSEQLFMQRLARRIPRPEIAHAPSLHAFSPRRPRAAAQTRHARELDREADAAARDARQAGRQMNQAQHEVEQQAHDVRHAAGLP